MQRAFEAALYTASDGCSVNVAMRCSPLLLAVLLAVSAHGCAEATYVEPEGGAVDEAILEKDVKVTPEDAGEEADAAVPEDLGGDLDGATQHDGGNIDAGAGDSAVAPDTVVDIDAGAPDAGPIDTGIIDTGPIDTGVIDTGVIDTGPVDTGPRDTGPVDTGPRDTGPVDTGPVDTGVVPEIFCPLLGTPIPIRCRGRNGQRPCCGIGGACFCEQASPFGPLCLPCN